MMSKTLCKLTSALLEELELTYRAEFLNTIAKGFSGKGSFAQSNPPPRNAIYIDSKKLKPQELVVSIDKEGTVRKDDCFQIYWVPATNGPTTIKTLCVKVHTINASLKFPVGSPQDNSFRAISQPTYFLTEGAFPIKVPPIPDRSPRELVDESKTFSDDMFFTKDSYRPAITAELYYTLDVSSQTRLVRDNSKSCLYHSLVKIDESLDFGSELEKALATLKDFKIKDTPDYPAMKGALEKAGIRSRHEAVIGAHLANLVIEALDSSANSAVTVPRTAKLQKCFVIRGGGRAAGGGRGRGGGGGRGRGAYYDSPPQKAEPFTFVPELSPLGMLLLSEFSDFAMTKVLSHPLLRKFLVTKEYAPADVSKVRAALAWATGGKELSPEDLPTPYLIEAYANVFGYQPELNGKLTFATEKDAVVRSRVTHPGRDYSHLLLQRLISLYIDSVPMTNENDPSSSKKPKTQDVGGPTEKQVAAKLFGEKFSSVEECKAALAVLNATNDKVAIITDAATAINTRLLLSASAKQSPSGELPLAAVVVAVKDRVVEITLPILHDKRFEARRLGTPIKVSVPWPEGSPLAPPPVGSTIPVLVKCDSKSGQFIARWYHPLGLSNDVLQKQH